MHYVNTWMTEMPSSLSVGLNEILFKNEYIKRIGNVWGMCRAGVSQVVQLAKEVRTTCSLEQLIGRVFLAAP